MLYYFSFDIKYLASALLAIVVAIFVIERHGLKGRIKKRKQHPVAGTVFHQLLNFSRLHDYMTNLARKHKTYRLLSLSGSEVYTSDPINVEYILKTNFANYGKVLHFRNSKLACQDLFLHLELSGIKSFLIFLRPKSW